MGRPARRAPGAARRTLLAWVATALLDGVHGGAAHTADYDRCVQVGGVNETGIDESFRCDVRNAVEAKFLIDFLVQEGIEAIDVKMHTMFRRLRSSGPPGKHGLTQRLQVLAGFYSTWTPIAGPSGISVPEDSFAAYEAAHSMICFPNSTDEHLASMTVKMLSDEPVDLMTVAVEIREEQKSNQSYTTRIGGSGDGSSVITSFRIEDMGQTLQKLRFRATALTLSSSDAHPDDHNAFHVYVFPELNPCITKFTGLGGCANPDEVLACLKGIDFAFTAVDDRNHIAQHISFHRSADLTLSQASLPPLQPGRWFALSTCEARIKNPNATCDARSLSMESEAVLDHHWPLIVAALAMFFGTGLALLLVDAIMFVAYKCVFHFFPHKDAQDYDGLWPAFCGCPNRIFFRVFRDRVCELCHPKPFFGPLLLFLIGIFFATAGQFVVAHYWLFRSTGACDICFYNTKCYFPNLYLDMPINHVIISHIPYFVAGFHVIVQAAFAESKAKRLAGGFDDRPLDLRTFYALGLTFMGEGLGSACYHLCPSLETFQFDTSFMIPIVHIAMTCLEDWEDFEEDQTSVLKYFLYVITPIWIFSFFGSWYDIRLFEYKILYAILTVLLILWAALVVQCLDRFFADSWGGRLIRRCLKTFLVAVLAISVLVPSTRDLIGGMANTFLLLSIVAMAVVVLRQIIHLELQYQRCGIREIGEHLLKYTHVVLMAIVGYYAMQCFQDKVVLVGPGISAASSHDINQDCILLGVLDKHDTWHFLSAIALALFAMILLDVKAHAFARSAGLKIAAEKLFSEEWTGSSDSDTTA